MRSPKKLTLTRRLILMQAAPLLALVAIIIALSAVALSVKSKAHQSRDESLVFANLAQEMNAEVIKIQESFEDVSATRALDGRNEGFSEAARHKQSFLASLERFRTMFANENDTRELQRVKEIAARFEAYYQAGLLLAQDYVQGGPELGNKRMDQFDKAAEELSTCLRPFVDSQVTELRTNLDVIEQQTRTLSRTALYGDIAALAGCITLLVLTIRATVGPIQQVANAMSMAADEVSAAAANVAEASQSQASGASQQAASVEETSASVEELSSMTRQNATHSQQANTVANQTRAAAEKGVADMKDMAAAIHAIRQSSDDVAKIIRTIDEIAFQTNILALNAAVEAARAGAAGLGFAVVADEVRNLAQRSAEAAKETSAKIESALGRTAHGVNVSNRVAQTLNEIVDRAREMDQLASMVADASQQQTQGISQVNNAIQEIDKVTQSNAANAEEAAAAAEELSGQAETTKRAASDLLEIIGGSQARHSTPIVARGSLPARARTRSSPGSKDLIEWDAERMTTGMTSIDDQHQQLIGKINQLHRACLAGAGQDELCQSMNFLAEYVQNHFEHEEELMDQHRCPSRAANKAAHESFLQKFRELKQKLERHGASTSLLLELRSFVGDWLTNHICAVDTKLRQCSGGTSCPNGRRSQSPAEFPMELA